MSPVEIPGFGVLKVEHLLLDYNGTIAVDGALLEGVADRIQRLSGMTNVTVLTADTFGRVREEMNGAPCDVQVLPETVGEAEAKLAVVERLGADRCAAVGNGANDALMLEAARLGMAVVGVEGAAKAAARAADVVVVNPLDALDLLLYPVRLVATLRR